MVSSTYEFLREPLINEGFAHAFFMLENSVISSKVILIVISKEKKWLKTKNIFYQKNLFSHPPN
jgi:hypothetical protein